MAFVIKWSSKEIMPDGLFVTHKHGCNCVIWTDQSVSTCCLHHVPEHSSWSLLPEEQQTNIQICWWMQVYIIWLNRAVPFCSWSKSCPTLALWRFWKLLATGWTPLELTLACHAAWRPVDNANLGLLCRCAPLTWNNKHTALTKVNQPIRDCRLRESPGESEMTRKSTCFQH